VDVECVASGPGHNDRSICSVAVVDIDKRVLLYKIVKPSVPVYNYLTVLTGFTEGSLEDGEPEESVLAQVHALLSPNVVIVGQSPRNDITWLKLQEGIHYNRIIDLAEVFKKTFPDGRVHMYSLEHEVRTLLMTEEELAQPQVIHTATNDAIKSMELYKRYGEGRCTNNVRQEAVNKLRKTPTIPSIAKRLNYFYEGVCMAAYSPHICKCGQPTKVSN